MGEGWGEGLPFLRFFVLLRSRRLAGYKFRRQHPVGLYSLDFYCVEAGVAVELDGSGHGFPERRYLDEQRDCYLAERDILVKQFWNHSLKTFLGRRVVIENLWRLLQERVTHPGNVAGAVYRRGPDREAEGPLTLTLSRPTGEGRQRRCGRRPVGGATRRWG
jgi:very-short-patch-repair endonuclease